MPMTPMSCKQEATATARDVRTTSGSSGRTWTISSPKHAKNSMRIAFTSGGRSEDGSAISDGRRLAVRVPLGRRVLHHPRRQVLGDHLVHLGRAGQRRERAVVVVVNAYLDAGGVDLLRLVVGLATLP